MYLYRFWHDLPKIWTNSWCPVNPGWVLKASAGTRVRVPLSYHGTPNAMSFCRDCHTTGSQQNAPFKITWSLTPEKQQELLCRWQMRIGHVSGCVRTLPLCQYGTDCLSVDIFGFGDCVSLDISGCVSTVLIVFVCTCTRFFYLCVYLGGWVVILPPYWLTVLHLSLFLFFYYNWSQSVQTFITNVTPHSFNYPI